MKKHTAAIERPLTSPRIDRFASCAGASFLGPRSRRSPPPPPPQGSIHLLKRSNQIKQILLAFFVNKCIYISSTNLKRGNQ